MRLALLLALQAAPQAPAEPLAIDFDLARVKPAEPCETGGAGGSDIVVCGRRPRGDLRPREMGARVPDRPAPRREGESAAAPSSGAYGESVEMPGGQVSKRAMVGVKLKF